MSEENVDGAKAAGGEGTATGPAGNAGTANPDPAYEGRECAASGGEPEAKGWDGFRRSTWGLVLAIGLVVFLDILLIMFRTCLTGALIAVVTFGLPYYFNMKRPRDLLVMGTAVIIFLSVFTPVFIHVTNQPNPTTATSGGEITNLTASHVAASYDESVNVTLDVNRTAGWRTPAVFLRVEGLTNWLQLFWPSTESTEGNLTMSRGGDYAYDSAAKEWRRATFDNATGTWSFAGGGNATGRVVTRFYLDRAMGTGDYQVSAMAVHRNDTANVTLYSVASVASDESVFIYKLFPWFIITYVVSTFIDTSLFYILVGMSWWLKRTKELTGIAGDASPSSGGAKPEFTCSDCGGDVYASEKNCPHCGAKLED